MKGIVHDQHLHRWAMCSDEKAAFRLISLSRLSQFPVQIRSECESTFTGRATACEPCMSLRPYRRPWPGSALSHPEHTRISLLRTARGSDPRAPGIVLRIRGKPKRVQPACQLSDTDPAQLEPLPSPRSSESRGIRLCRRPNLDRPSPACGLSGGETWIPSSPLSPHQKKLHVTISTEAYQQS